MNKFVNFGSIEGVVNQFRSLKQWAKFHDSKVKSFSATGSVKVHGTNMGISYWKEDDSIMWQTRNQVLTPTDADGFGMGFFVNQVGVDTIRDMLKPLVVGDAVGVVVFGELFGKGIQKGVGVSELDKSFMAFTVVRVYNDVDTDGTHCWKREYLTLNDIQSIPEKNFYRSCDFKTFNLDNVDVYDEQMVERIMDITINEVEKVCPVASALKDDLECTTGEGIVWTATVELESGHIQFVTFKSKGDKHKRSEGSAKSKKSVEFTDVQNDAIAKFFDVAMTNDRLEQGFESLVQSGKTVEMQNIGMYIKWVVQDVQKEHTNDVVDILYPVGLEWKNVQKAVTNAARDYFVSKLNNDTI